MSNFLLNRPRHKDLTSCKPSYLMLFILLTLALSGCRSSKKAHDRSSGKTKIETVSVNRLKGLEKKIVEEALTWQGTPYRYGASEKGRGTDCSGMVVAIFEKIANKKLPRNSAKQAEFCKPLKAKDVRSGDLAFFATGKDKGRISHVGIMIDATRFVHASSQKGVLISEINTPYYQRTFRMFGRVP